VSDNDVDTRTVDQRLSDLEVKLNQVLSRVDEVEKGLKHRLGVGGNNGHRPFPTTHKSVLAGGTPT
jgi:hypothetical protein